MTELDSALRVRTTRDLGRQFVQNSHRMVGQDGAYSIPLGDGRTLWFFGDTLIGQRPEQSLDAIFRQPVNGRVETGPGPFEQMITNTGLLLPAQTGEGGLHGFSYILDTNGRLKKLVPSLPGEDPDLQRVWCLHGVKLGNAIYLYYMLVLMHEMIAGPGDLGFEVVGSGLAVGSERDWTFRRLPHDGETLWWSVDQPQFGVVALHDDPTGYVYLFGSLQDRRPVQEAHLARVRPDQIEALDRYEYFTGDGWSHDLGRSRCLFSGQPNEMSVSYNAYLGKYLAVHSLALSGDIVGRTADRLWGPWSEPAVLWSVPDDQRAVQPGDPSQSFYAGKEHPALAGEDGRIIYLTYVGSSEYYPHLVEVTLV